MTHLDVVEEAAQRAVRRVGVFPKVFSTGLLAMTLFAVAVGNDFSLITPGLALAIVPLSLVAMSLRVKATVTSDSIVFRSYLRTYEFRLADISVIDLDPYDGLFFRGVAVEGVLGLWLTQLTVVKGCGSERELQSTVMFLPQARRLVRELRPYLPNWDDGEGPFPPHGTDG